MSAAHSKVALTDAQVQHAVWAMLASVRGPAGGQAASAEAEDAKGSGALNLEQFRCVERACVAVSRARAIQLRPRAAALPS